MKGRQTRGDKNRVTLVDVAHHVGVSAITVSRALREPQRVSPQLRGRVLEAVEHLGYVPDLAARSLASRDSGVIALIVPTLTYIPFLDVMAGIEDRFSGSGFGIQYTNTRSDGDLLDRQVSMVLAQRPSGMIFIGVAPAGETLARLRRAACPIVQISDVRAMSAGTVIGIDSEAAARLATRHMIDKGYSRIVLVEGHPCGQALLRHEGFRNAMQAAGLYDPRLEMCGGEPSSVPLGARVLQRIRETLPDAEAVFCHNDDLALGILFECQRLGIRVPQDFGICGFNDLDFAAIARPSLTTVHVARYTIGRKAADAIIDGIGSGGLRPQTIDIGFTLIERQSTQRDAPTCEIRRE